jgi:hypothetical protein
VQKVGGNDQGVTPQHLKLVHDRLNKHRISMTCCATYVYYECSQMSLVYKICLYKSNKVNLKINMSWEIFFHRCFTKEGLY